MYRKHLGKVLKTHTLAMSNSVSALTGSWYLGISNKLSNSKLDHGDLDHPESIGHGFKKSIINFGREIKCGITGLWR